MIHTSINNIKLINNEDEYKNSYPKIIAVSKTFSKEDIKPLIDYGHNHFGENKVQEAQEKWSELRSKQKS